MVVTWDSLMCTSITPSPFAYSSTCLRALRNPTLSDVLSPNVITVMGFSFTLFSFVAIYGWFGVANHGEVSSSFLVLLAIFYLAARILDEMDGKQARRTGNASPLGLMVDHGFDTYTCGFISMALMKTC